MRFISSIIACAMLGFMFVLMFFSAWNDSATMDELAHIPAGYSYLTERDYRLNPEHPPLIKDLAAFPLLYLNLNFPTGVKAWADDINGQWNMGRIFLYESGNDADKILRFSRFPIMLLALLFGWLLFRWVRKTYGDKIALLVIFFFSLSPTLIAHSRYVTTDLAAAFGFFIGIASFLNFLNSQNTPKKYLIICGIASGAALLLKFSLVLLAPLFIIFGILWVILENWHKPKKIWEEALKMLGRVAVIGLMAAAIITLVYLFHVSSYSPERQKTDTEFILSSFSIRPLANLTIWLSDKPILRAFGEYLLGLLMVIQRAGGGNTAYFMGEISGAGWRSYFPALYLFKEQLAFHILTLIAIIYSVRSLLKAKEKNINAVAEWLKDNFALTAMMIFIAVYWAQSISSPLNIGIRHVLPTFPFIYILVSRQIIRWLKTATLNNPLTFGDWLKDIWEIFIKRSKKYGLIVLLLFWMIISAIFVFPYYLSYYNILTGGTSYGYKIAVDSNYDWGQDLKRLKNWVDKNLPADGRVAIDYFGGGNPQYYLEDKFTPWHSSNGEPPTGTWFAVSATFLQTADYSWLKDKKPITRAGASIFIYKF